jgi:hypothetical protein
MTYTKEFDADTFEWWSGACDTIKDIREAGLIDELTAHIEEVFGFDEEPPTDTALNDYVWFERDSIYEALGLDENGKLPSEDEDEDEE